jgi:hypothetical protein
MPTSDPRNEEILRRMHICRDLMEEQLLIHTDDELGNAGVQLCGWLVQINEAIAQYSHPKD